MRVSLIAFLTLAQSWSGSCAPHRVEAFESGHPTATRAVRETPHRAFDRSPGGTPEVSPTEVLARLRGGAATPPRVVDVRDAEELVDELGHIAGVEHVPLYALEEAAATWDPAQPVVLVCRTGRRSSRGVARLEARGFRQVASMTGGMLRWVEQGLPVSRTGHDVRTRPVPADRGATVQVTVRGGAAAPPLEIDPASVRYVRTTALLTSGSESCVDGRDPHAVVGTPGGDAGEFLVTLAAAETLGSPVLDGAEIEALLDDWIATFGRFYVHSDGHALEHARRAVRGDPRFIAQGVSPDGPAAMEALVRDPPHGLEEALLDVLVEPENVGCGHLRAMLLDPRAYGVRPDLATDVLRAIFRHLWRAPDEIDWVVLEGEHGERAVVVVQLAHEVHPYTRVPAIAPSVAGRQAFVLHPQVTEYLREQNASFLLERSPSLARSMTVEQLRAGIRTLAARQLDATLGRLAGGLPIYEARFGPVIDASR